MRAADGTKGLLWLTWLERDIWTAKSCDLTERLRRGSIWRCSGSSWQSGSRGLSIIHTVEQCEGPNFSSGSQWLNLVRDEVILRKVNDLEMYTAQGAYSKYVPGAVCSQIMLLEHIWLRALLQIIYGPVVGHNGPGAYCPRPQVEAKISKKQTEIEV